MSVVLAGTTLGASALLPGTALAQPSRDDQSRHDQSRHDQSRHDQSRHDQGQDDQSQDSRRPARRRPAHARPLSSGERQYRNGCLRGYILEDCEQFDVRHLLRRGINPFL